jgi:hypothetical protein
MEPETKWDLTAPPKQINITWKYADQFYDNLEKQKENKVNELFEISYEGKTTYGFKLAMNSENKLVMEEKGTGKIIVVGPDAVKEVLPYTISVGSFSGDAVRSYTIEPGKVAVNDIVLHQPKGTKSFGLGVVTAIDTKAKGAPQFTGSRLVAEIIV